MSEKAILQAVLHQIHDAIEAARPLVERKEERLEKPLDAMNGLRLRSNGLSERPIYEDGVTWNAKIVAFEHWPALEPLHRLAKRVELYINSATS